MKTGLGLYYHMLNDKHFSFARHCGVSNVVVHLTDYFHKGSVKKSTNQPIGNSQGWGVAGSNPHVWEYDYLLDLRKQIETHGLVLTALENFDPSLWYAILLDLPQKKKQMERLKQIIKNIGRAGIAIIGYNFSLAGVCSRTEERVSRGGALSVVMKEIDTTEIPSGMVWNMVYDETELGKTTVPRVEHDELWQRLSYFLTQIIPIAEEHGVRLAAHPDDPPVAYVRQQARLVYKAQLYQRLLDLVPSRSNAFEFCLGSMQEMSDLRDEDGSERDLLYWLERYVKQDSIAYIHFRNVQGKAPQYQETFIDEGDIDMKQVVEVLERNNFTGVLIPDHSPQISCDAPWHAGMAYALGYMNAIIGKEKS